MVEYMCYFTVKELSICYWGIGIERCVHDLSIF